MGTTGSLATAVALAETASAVGSTVAIDAAGAGVVFTPGFASACASTTCPASFGLQLTHIVDALLLVSVASASSATAPGAALIKGQSGRRLLAAPAISGALSTTVISGVVNFTSGLDGLGTTAATAILINVPLDAAAYDPSLPAACLRLDASGLWRSDGITLHNISNASPSATIATCALSNLNNNQVCSSLAPPQKKTLPPTLPPSNENTQTSVHACTCTNLLQCQSSSN